MSVELTWICLVASKSVISRIRIVVNMTYSKLFAIFTVLAILPLCFACKSSPPETGKPYLRKLRIKKVLIWFYFQEVITKLEVILIWIGKEVTLEVQAKPEEISEDQAKPAQTMAFKLKAL